MENVEGTSLQQMLKLRPERRVDEAEGANLFYQILSAIDYLH